MKTLMTLKTLIRKIKENYPKSAKIKLYDSSEIIFNDLDNHILNKRCKKVNYAIIVRVTISSYEIINRSFVDEINKNKTGYIKLGVGQHLYYSDKKSSLINLLKEYYKYE